MIKLDKLIYDDEIKSKYVEHCIKRIKRNYNYKKNNSFYSSEEELFNGKISRKSLYCDSIGNLDEDKIEAILLMDFDENDLEIHSLNDPLKNLKNHYKNLNNYFKTGLLISRLRILINNQDCETTNEKIVKYLNKYKNSWIEGYFKNFIDESRNQLNAYITKDDINGKLDDIEEQYKKITLLDSSNNKEKHIFNYSWINGKNSMRDELLASTNISVCPYCNRQFVSKFKKYKNVYKSTATIDHFYPKSKFPLFALSLYNFIPACHICNEILKKQDVREIMYPFKQGYENNAHFMIEKYKDLDALLGKNTNFNLCINIEHTNETISNSIELFKTKEIYNTHKDYVQSIIKKHHIYSDKYKDMLRDDLKKIGLNYSEAGLEAFLYNLDPNDNEQTNVILGRLTKDILKMIDDKKKLL